LQRESMWSILGGNHATQLGKDIAMKVVIDITEMAKATGLDEQKILEELMLDKPYPELAEWIPLVEKGKSGTLDLLQNLLGLASHFVKRE
jgi:hypothetical protein